jgi:gentisate 1,2-dioxygenase
MNAIPTSAELARFSRDIAPLNLMPLWERTTRMKPGTACLPAHWRYAELRPLLLRAAALISKRDAERRVLVLENPGLRGSGFITQSLYAGLQIILPGEIAPAHRHSPSALRFVVEGEGAYTSVEGERVPMQAGDFIVTANWNWHDHGHEGTAPAVWMDGLDTPLAAFFGAMFREDGSAAPPRLPRREGETAARFGAHMLPLESRATAGAASPLLRYPYERSREALTALARSGDPDPAHGYRLRYASPANGGHPFPTIAVFLQWLPAGFAGRAYRSTESTVFNVVEGRGSISFAATSFDWAPHDVFVVPPWEAFRLSSAEDSVLFSYSDRAAQEALGFLREEQLD